MQDRVPQARIYRVWHAAAGGAIRQLSTLELFADVLVGQRERAAGRRLVLREAAGDRGRRLRRHAGAEQHAVSCRCDVKPGADPAAAEREMDAVVARPARAGPDAGRAAARAKPRIFADFARGLERLGGFGGRSDVLAESHDLSTAIPTPTSTRLERTASGDAGRRPRRRARLAVEAALHAVGHAVPELVAGADAIDRKLLPALAAPPEVKFPKVAARDARQRPEGDPARAPFARRWSTVDAGGRRRLAADPLDARGHRDVRASTCCSRARPRATPSSSPTSATRSARR